MSQSRPEQDSCLHGASLLSTSQEERKMVCVLRLREVFLLCFVRAARPGKWLLAPGKEGTSEKRRVAGEEKMLEGLKACGIYAWDLCLAGIQPSVMCL